MNPTLIKVGDKVHVSSKHGMGPTLVGHVQRIEVFADKFALTKGIGVNAALLCDESSSYIAIDYLPVFASQDPPSNAPQSRRAGSRRFLWAYGYQVERVER